MTRIFLLLCVLVADVHARADDPSRDASRHFTRGVDLYNDGDFRGALVEFKKAYSIWPRATVLYDIGQTEYQLLDYASALTTMSRYLAETGPNAAHRSEVEATVETLRGRVGRISVQSDTPDCEVLVDDQARGQTPLSQPLLVSMGSRRVTLSCSGHGQVSRQIEVAGGETLRMDLRLPVSAAPKVGANAVVMAKPKPPTTRNLAIGWTVTAVLAGGAIGLGSSALVASRDLAALKDTYPVPRETLDHQANVTSGLAIAFDVVGVAALVAAGVSAYLTVKYTKDKKAYF
jgi:hypothetical protein